MRNPLSDSNEQTRIERLLAKCRGAARRLSGGEPRQRRPLHVWAAAALLCVSLAGCFSLVRLAKRGSSKGEVQLKVALATNDTEKIASALAQPEKSLQVKVAPKIDTAPKTRKAGSSAAKTATTTQPEQKQQPSTQIPLRPLVLAPPAVPDGKGEGDKEDAEISRKRESWFFDQRAYPNKHIPAGAYQKALEQRDAMKAAQRAASGSAKGSTSDATLINFPGDALWHLMGPQPISAPFDANSGFPTASGRITAIAVDPSDATGKTVYVGGAAGGVWKTTDGGTTWTPLTDTQPSLSIGSITIDPNNSQTIYVGTGEENFNIDAFYGAGILKSTNGGATWTQLGASTFAQALGPDTGGAYIGQIAVQPGNSSIVLAAVSYVVNGTIGGIYRSTDGGNTWTEDASPRGLGATSVFFESTSNAGTTATAWMAMGDFFALGAGESPNGIYKSTDSGATWTLQTGGLPTANVGRIILGYAASTSGSTATIYAAIATVNSTTSPDSEDLLGLFKTTNGGTTWTPLSSAPAFCNHQCFYDMAIGVHPTNPSVVVLGGGAYTDNFTSLFESQNGGTSWTPAGTLGNPPPAGDFANGSTTTHPHVDTHAIVFTPSAATLYVGDDGGIWSTATPTPTAGVSPTWSDLNNGLALTQFYPGPSAGVADENTGFGGTQDNDIEFFNNSLEWTNESICGDGGFTAIDQKTPSTIWAACNSTAGVKLRKGVYDGQFINTTTFGQIPGFDTAETVITGSNDAMEFIPPIALDESNPDNLYFGTCRVWMTNNAASSLANTFIPLTPNWAAVSGDLSNANATVTTSCASNGPGQITNIEVAHSSSSVIVAGTSNGKVWETTDGGLGNLWTEIDAPALPNRTVTAVRTQRNDSTGAIVYATFSGFGACTGCDGKGHIFKTTTAGTTNTWTDISGDLPDIPVNDIIVDHESNPAHDALYIATDVGVFACPNPLAAPACANWTVIGDGLPNSPVLGLTMRRSSRILRAATHGRSMWQIQLSDVNPPAVAALSSVTPAAVNAGAATTPVSVTGVNFSPNTQVQFEGISGAANGVTTTFVNTTQLNVSLSSPLLTTGGVYSITITDSQGVDSGSALGSGGLPFTVMNPLLDPLTMTPNTAMAYTAVPFVFTATAAEPFLTNSVLAFYDTSNPPVLKFQLPTIQDQIQGQPTVSGGGTTYKLTTAITDLTMPGTYQVVPYNPPPGGTIDPVAINSPTFGLSGPVPFQFTLTANPGPVIQVSSPLSLSVNALGANTGTTYDFYQVSNLVGATLNITNATITGTLANGSGNFQFIAPAAGPPSCNFESTKTVSLTAGSSCFFGLEYTAGTPPGNAQSTATLNITDNATGSPQGFPIAGNIQPTPSLLLLSPVNFGGVAVSATSPTMNATLANLGGASVSVTSGFSISGTNQADFHIASFVSNGDTNSACPAPPFTLVPAPPGAGQISACDVSLTFTPSLPAGNESANLNVSASATVTPPPPNLFGTGIEITSISPEIVATGGPAFTLTVNGGGFASSAVVNVNGSARLTTFVSANQLKASIPASDIATAGSLAISVTTPSGGTTSEPKTLIVAQAEPATNDNVNFAVAVLPANLPFRMTQDTTQATTQSVAFTGSPATPVDPLPCGSGSKAKSVWFAFTPTASGKVVADTRFSSYTTILSSWTISTPLPSSTATFAPVACNTANVPASGAAPAASLITFPVTSGTTYYLMVTDGGGTGAGGTLTLSLDFASAAPGNDDFNNATDASATPFSNTVNSIEATTNTGGRIDPTPSCAPGGSANGGAANSVWYKYAATATGTVTADTLTSPYDTILTVVTGSPGSFSPVMCNDNASAGIAQSQVSFGVSSGTTYFIMVSAVLGDGGTTDFHLTFNATTVGPATKLAFTQEPTNVAAGASIAPAVTVTIQDASGNTVTSATNQVTVAILNNAGGGTLSGTLTQSPTNGVATFSNLSINKIGTGYTLTATAVPSLTAANSSAFNVTAGTAATVTAASGSGQSATISTAFAAPLVATVTDSGGNPVSGVTVTFTPPGSGASGTFAAGGNTGVTGANGQATSGTFTANSTAGGPYNVVASATGATSANFALTNKAGAAAKVTATSGSGQSATISTAFAAPLVATVTDSGGNPVSGVTVTFTPPGSGASGTFAVGGNTGVTGANGQATSGTFTANSTAGGPYNVVASATGAASANFAETNKVGAAAKVSATGGTPQSAAINTAFGAPLVATVTDSGGNPVSGVTVTFTPPGSGASGTFAAGGNTGVTGANGQATSGTFTANSTAGGPYNVVASATGAASANFALTNLSGTPATVAATGGTPQSVPIDKPFAAFVVTVTDSSSNPVSGVIVTFTPPASGASGTFAGGVNTATTNASGVATSAIFTANGIAGGPYNVVASAAGAASANFVLTNLVGAAATVTATSGTPQSVAITKPFAALVATVTDSGGNPVSGVMVTFTPPASGASGTFAGGVNTATTNASGMATSAIFTANSTAGGPYNVVASVTGAASANFVLTNLVGPAATVSATSGTPQSVAITKPFAAFVATVTDSGGNPVSGVVVTFTPPASGASGTFAGGVNTTTTNASGVATSAIFTANSTVGGPYNVVASATGATSANFVLTNTAGPPATITAVSGTPQTVALNTAFATLQAVVKDAGGNLATGVPVTFTAPSSGASGTFANGTNTVTVNTDNTGTASATTFTANFTNGTYNVNATVSGVNAPAPFALTNNANAPTLTSPLSPASAAAGGAAFVLTVNGTNFATTSVVSFNGVAMATTFVSGTQLTANITAAAIATAGNVNVSVTTPAPGGGTSGNLTFAINNPVPTTTTISPTSTTAGGAGFMLTVTGTNFLAASVVNFNGAAKATTFNPATPTQLTAAITATDIANGGVVNVTVTNPAPGGGTSAPALQFTINNVQPVLTTLSPTSKLAGSGAFTLTVNGNAGSFVKGAVVTFNGIAETTTFVTSSQLTANINAADIATAGNLNVIVTNPAPAVGPSTALTFVVNNPVPTISAATAGGQNHIAGGAAFTLTVTGTNFVTGTNEASVISFNGKAEPTTFVSGTQITAAIPATDVATAGPFNVSVTNPGPGGGPTPTTIAFTIDGYTLAGSGSAVTVKAGVQAVFPITITPSANGFANAVVFSVSGLPAHAGLEPLTVPNVTTKATVNVTIDTTSRGAAPPTSPFDQPLPPAVRFLVVTWLCAMLAGIYAVIMIRRRPQWRRFAVLVPLVLLLLGGAVLAGCASGMNGTPAGTFQLTVTATSGTLSQSTPATLTVQ